jgi:RNA ligase (TIGR02306 family)
MENNNSVCYIARIGEIVPIPGADNIEVVLAGGWQAIVQKGQYAEGGLVIVATTDAVIPVELSDEINVTNYLRKGQRVRTVKLRGMYSECLIIPLSHLSGKLTMGHPDVKEGMDMMEVMSIFKYEPPARQVQLSSGRKIKYQDNPNFHVYYKFPNLKNVAGMFTEDDEVEITRKIHGTNARYGIVKKKKISIWDKVKRFFGNEWIEYEYVYGSHNVEKGSDSQGFYDTDVWRTVADKYNIREKLWELFKVAKELYNINEGITIYGEIYGLGIQKNFDYGLKEIDYVGFDVTINGEYCDSARSWAIQNILDLNYVPTLYYGNWSQEIQDSFVFNTFIEGTKIPHEGIVIKSLDGNRHKVAKVINPDYLIYGEKHDIGDSH